MDKIIWSDELLINHPTLDAQHKILIRQINLLIDNSNLDAHSETISDVINELINFTSTHFSEEEKILKECNFEELEKHKKEHLEFIEDIAEISMKIFQNDQTVQKQLLITMCDLYKNHILDEVKGLSPYF